MTQSTCTVPAVCQTADCSPQTAWCVPWPNPPALYRLSARPLTVAHRLHSVCHDPATCTVPALPVPSANASLHHHCFLCRIRECLSRIFSAGVKELLPKAWYSLTAFKASVLREGTEVRQNVDFLYKLPAAAVSVTPQHRNMLFFPLLHSEIFKKLQSNWIEQHSYCEEVLHISM
jgi:hypothetical protein